MKTTKKIISLLLSILMIITSVPLMTVESFAATSGTIGDCTWTLDGTVLTISGNGKMGEYGQINSAPWGTSITKVVIENGVTSIGWGNFIGCTSLTSITIPDSVTSIETVAFCDCTSLTSITIPDSVTSIGGEAFKGSAYYNNESNWDNGILYIGNHLIKAKENVSGSVEIKQGTKTIASSAFKNCTLLTSVTIPDSVTSMGFEAFSGCTSLTSATIGNGVTSIGDYAFSGCTSLTSVTIPDSVTEIGWDVFSFSSLVEINVNSNNANYSSENGVLFNKEKTELIKYPERKTESEYIIPDSVTSIEAVAFFNCTSLASITIPDSVSCIGDEAFGYCKSLTSVTILGSVTSIGRNAFENCTSLANIIIPDSVTGICERVFYKTAYYNNESNWDNGILYIGNHLIKAKENVSGNVEIKQGTKTIAGSAFSGCTSLTSVTIPDSVTSIVYEAFSYCTSLTSVTIGNGVTNIGDYAFFDCKALKSITIPNNVMKIDVKALGYYYDSHQYYKIEDFVIYGNKGSEAERYANENGFKFAQAAPAPTMSFPDVRSGDWYSDAVKYNFERGYITGYSNGTFGPSNNIQRQDFVLILARIAGVDLSAYEGQNGGFSDVQAGAYYASAVAWAKDKGIVTGYSADNFGVGTYITREQISLILCRYLNGSASGDVDTILNAYSDGGNTSPWAKAGVAWAVENGIIGNSDYLNPNGNAGRAEVAQIIYNMSNKGML